MSLSALYPPLRFANSIRLLTLQPGQVSEDLKCTIKETTIDRADSYQALSYAWTTRAQPKACAFEDGTTQPSILCDNVLIKITSNLASALRQLRMSDSPRILWIDQLCINQQNLGEREQQIRCMGAIFSGAANVVAWLGEADQDTPIVWKLFQSLRLILQYERTQTYHLGNGSKPEEFSSKSMGAHHRSHRLTPFPAELARLPPTDGPEWIAMRHFLQREWFSRVWTLQELVVSRKCHVLCGTYAITWEDLAEVAFALELAGFSRPLLRANLWITVRDIERQRWRRNEKVILRYLLAVTRGSGVTEAHDKVYALLALAGDFPGSRLPVHYAKPLTELFIDVARTCILEENTLAVLSEVEIRSTHGIKIPSWVPNWCNPASTYQFLARSGNHGSYFTAAGRSVPEMVQSDRSDHLMLKGFLIAPIMRILDARTALGLTDRAVSSRDLKDSRWHYRAWSGIYRSAVHSLDIPVSSVRAAELPDPYVTRIEESSAHQATTPSPRDMLQTALRRTVLADLYPQPHGRLTGDDSARDFPAFKAWEHRNFHGAVPPQVLLEHDEAAAQTTYNRCVFIAGPTDNAFMGLGLRTCREGDWICILFGGNTPFILRPSHVNPDAFPSEVNEWTLVSDCYVHGLMDGEAMEHTRDPGCEYKDFVLTGDGHGLKAGL